MTNDELAEARRLCDAATPGPWNKCYAPDTNTPAAVSDRDFEYIARTDIFSIHSDDSCIANAAFIAAARSLIPALLAHVERLTKERDALAARRDELLTAMVRVTNETPFADEAKDALAQRGKLIAEIGTLKAKLEIATTALERVARNTDDAIAFMPAHEALTAIKAVKP
jgi:hypothetical protein